MKLLFIFVLLAIASCNKDSKTGQCDAFLTITSTLTAKTTTQAAGISSVINSYGPNLCYTFSHTEVLRKPGNIFEIKSKGKFPCNATICADALYQARDSINIDVAAPGTYFLKFYHNTSAFFKTDTVQVN